MPTKNIAVLIFARSIEEEVKHKPFLAQGGLAKSLSTHTKNIALNSGLPVLYYDETKQIGTDFGSRFSNALINAYSKGYDAIITIGNDCPYLQTKHIIETKKALENNTTVLGPTFDGGFYLLGLSKEHFDCKAFLNYSWNTEAVFKEIYNDFLKNDGKCLTLEKLQDIDHSWVLKQLSLHTISNTELRKIIQSLTTKRIRTTSYSDLNELDIQHPLTYNKGSPLLRSFQAA